MSCKHCENQAIYKCSLCGNILCADHAKLRTVCQSCIEKPTLEHSVEKVSSEEQKIKIREFVESSWGEQEQLAFDGKFLVTTLPAYGAIVQGNFAGFISFADVSDAIIIVALGILPTYQDAGIGRSLVERVETEAKRLGKRRVLVSTSNDDLPALAFYQSIGFQIFEVKTDVIAEKHGQVLKGIGGLPIRDELRLRRILC